MLCVAFILVSLLLPILACGEYLMAESINNGKSSSVVNTFIRIESMETTGAWAVHFIVSNMNIKKVEANDVSHFFVVILNIFGLK
jgi:hypothetical protein